jgi:hypothetical protein
MPESEKQPTNLSTTSPTAAAEARQQAAQWSSPWSPITVTFDSGKVVELPPHPALSILDDDQLEAYEAVLFETESFDRHPDVYIPEQKAKDSAGNEITLPAQTQRGALMYPHRKGGALMGPQTVRIVKAVLGADEYTKLRGEKIDGRRFSAGEVYRLWNQQQQRLDERARDDSKSVGGDLDMASVPEADRG